MPMRILWLTPVDPEPQRDGQRMYSGRLIDAVAKAGAQVDVICFESEHSAQRTRAVGDIVGWHTVKARRRPAWLSPLSSLPNVAYRHATPEMMSHFIQALKTGFWDTIVFDSICSGWALSCIEKLQTAPGHRPQIIYVAHNHEESTRLMMAHHYDGWNPLKQAALFGDARKSARLEHRLVRAADMVTAITEEDAAKFRHSELPPRRLIVLPPGYAGDRLQNREITDEMPRLAVIVGSFNWVAKQMNLEAFLKVADPLFARAGVRLRIVGDGPREFLKKLEQQTEATEFVGRVPRVEPYMADARIAIVPERVGGGFKLKILDYVFHRLPILAVNGSMSGAPLKESTSMLIYKSLEDLAAGVVDSIDDLPLLNRMQETAFDTCANRFDWHKRGRLFVSHMAAI